MRYMFLIYSLEQEASADEMIAVAVQHRTVMDEARRIGILRGADPLESTGTSTTVRVSGGKTLITDGPFAETKEQLAGYYILDCRDLDEAIEWAARIPTGCSGGAGCIEIRPIREMYNYLPADG